MVYCGHTVMLYSSHTVLQELSLQGGMKFFSFLRIHEFCFTYQPKLNAKNIAWNFGHFFILFQKICARMGWSNLWHGVKRR